MKLEQYISELLFQYDCVIVPNLGGFVTNYKSATIQPIQNKLYPPSKGISFNKNLHNNDGLLINFIAQKEGITYDVALKNIETLVVKINADLKLKKRVLLDTVGTLFLDNENRIQFEPDNAINYLLDSYGLTVFQKQPIKRVSLEDKITKEFKDRTAPLVVVKEKKTTKKILIAAAITIPLALFAIWIPSQTDLTGNLNYADFNPFKPTEKAVYIPNTTEITVEKNDTPSNVKEQIALADENTYFLDVQFDEASTPFTVKLKDQPTAEAVTTYVATNKQELRYHIIGGCFSEKSNAKKLVKQLKKDGFNAWIIGKRKGLWTVSYSSFTSRKEALDVLTSAKAHNSKAWVLNQ
jgi:nucleoid DNA-binding protein